VGHAARLGHRNRFTTAGTQAGNTLLPCDTAGSTTSSHYCDCGPQCGRTGTAASESDGGLHMLIPKHSLPPAKRGCFVAAHLKLDGNNHRSRHATTHSRASNQLLTSSGQRWAAPMTTATPHQRQQAAPQVATTSLYPPALRFKCALNLSEIATVACGTLHQAAWYTGQ
jgi:hypothetical protein